MKVLTCQQFTMDTTTHALCMQKPNAKLPKPLYLQRFGPLPYACAAYSLLSILHTSYLWTVHHCNCRCRLTLCGTMQLHKAVASQISLHLCQQPAGVI